MIKYIAYFFCIMAINFSEDYLDGWAKSWVIILSTGIAVMLYWNDGYKKGKEFCDEQL